MAINNPVADASLIEKLNNRLEEFRKLRVGYDPKLDEKAKKKDGFFKRLFG